MNCRESLLLLYEVLDRESSSVDTEEFKKHLEECRPCLENYQIEEAFQKFIVQKANQETNHPGLADFKARVKEKLDRIDSDDNMESKSAPKTISQSPDIRFPLVNRFLAIAATLVLVVGAAYIGKGVYHHHEDYIPLEQAHWGIETQMASYQNEAATSLSLASVNDNFGYNLLPQVAGFDLHGGRIEEIMGIKMEHFVYTMGDKKVSVFVAPAGEFEIPEELFKANDGTDDGKFYDHHCRGCRLVYHKVGDAIIVTGTTDRDVELLEFIPGTVII